MQKRISVGAIILPLLFALNTEAADGINIIPLPEKVQLKDGFFTITPQTQVLTSKDAEGIGQYLNGLLKPAMGGALTLRKTAKVTPENNSILLIIKAVENDLGDEGYKLDVTPTSVAIIANAPAGLFYGVQTLRQLLPPAIESPTKVDTMEWQIPCVAIEDKPRFAWRGMHLDVGRHFFSVEFVKRYIDLLALHKMNTFHWHLTEDQGWRIEIKKYPKLTEVGAWRDAKDGGKYGGFYTQEQIKEVVAFAAERFITVVPEIEMPGHCMAALASYPELGCTGGPYQVRTRWGVEENVFCAGNEKTYQFLEDVLTEVIALFPSEYIHIGGDEVPKQMWKKCAKCQAMMKKHDIKNEHELQSYFIKRIEEFINQKGRKIIGWDEILEGGLAPNAAVMNWRGKEASITAAKAGHPVVMSPGSHCYFDKKADKKGLSVSRVYSFEPIPDGLPAENHKYILGAQGNVWTENMTTTERVEYMAFPRATALAEVLWSPKVKRSYEDFKKRLPSLLQRLKILGVNYNARD